MIVGKKYQYYANEQLGAKRLLTPEGFLLCLDAPVARTGVQLYGAGEVPVPPNAEGFIDVEREAAEVFHPDTIASFNGKPIVNGHPDEDVTPENWNRLSVGVMLNPRRGAGQWSDYIVADLLITNKDAIAAVNNGLRELSLGYDANYKQMADSAGNLIPGRARQTDIRGNHCALVEAARCGSSCSIGDGKVATKDCRPKELNMSWIDKVKAAFAGKDEAALNAALAEAPKGETIQLTTSQLKALNRMTHDAEHKEDCDCAECKKTKDRGYTKDAVVDAVFADKRFTDVADNVARIADAFEKKDKEDEEEEEETKDDANRAIEGSLEMEAPPGTSDGVAAKAKDSAYLADSFQESVSLAEVIAPGISIPTFDTKLEPKKTYDALCAFRRRVLDAADRDPATHVHIDSLTKGKGYAKATCDGVRTLFYAVGEFKKQANNAAAKDHVPAPRASGGGTGAVGAVTSIAALNKKHEDYWNKQA